MEAYENSINEARLPIYRGLTMNRDDEIRQSVINELICHFKLDFAEVEERYGFKFSDYFSDALAALKPMADDGLLSLTEQGIKVEPRGKMLIRNICMQFDGYFKQQIQQQQKLYSKVI